MGGGIATEALVKYRLLREVTKPVVDAEFAARAKESELQLEQSKTETQKLILNFLEQNRSGLIQVNFEVLEQIKDINLRDTNTKFIKFTNIKFVDYYRIISMYVDGSFIEKKINSFNKEYLKLGGDSNNRVVLVIPDSLVQFFTTDNSNKFNYLNHLISDYKVTIITNFSGNLYKYFSECPYLNLQ